MTEFLAEIPDRRTGPGGGDPLLKEFAEKCRANPGLWAAWPAASTAPRQIGPNIRHGRYTAFREGKWEAAVRQGVCYVRYVGAS